MFKYNAPFFFDQTILKWYWDTYLWRIWDTWNTYLTYPYPVSRILGYGYGYGYGIRKKNVSQCMCTDVLNEEMLFFFNLNLIYFLKIFPKGKFPLFSYRENYCFYHYHFRKLEMILKKWKFSQKIQKFFFSKSDISQSE